ncbi:MAG: hypothetical protein ACJA13_001828 [Paraglaciecola sp.]|jgi:hypothetical protein
MPFTSKVRRFVIRIIMCGCIAPLSMASYSAQMPLWSAAPQAKSQDQQRARVTARRGNYLKVDGADLQQRLADKSGAIILPVPLPDGGSKEFVLTYSPVMSKVLGARYPQMLSFEGYELGQPHNTGRFAMTHKGLSGLFRQQNQWVLLSAQYENNPNLYVSYFYQDAIDPGAPLFANDTLLAPPSAVTAQSKSVTLEKSTGQTLHTYRLALSATSEYTAKVGGSKADAVAEMVSLVNRVNQILLADLAIGFELVDNHDIIFLDAQTDPYTNSDQAGDIETNQQVIDDALGPDNYDIGHLLGTNPGGLAVVPSVCNNEVKAKGYSGNINPQGERFYIDLVIHELGHQLGAKHTFNAQDQNNCGADQRSASSAFEPGSGSTIMSYSGICGEQNLQTSSDPYFHAGSIEQILNYVENGLGRTCATSNALDNVAPAVELTATTYTVPANTALVLTAQASDPDGDSLSYNWEQLDAGGLLGGSTSAQEMQTDNGANPLFRSYPANVEPYRYFPKLSDVLVDKVSFGEAYPSTNRELNFRVSVKDGKGGMNSADVAVQVIDTGATFAVLDPTTGTNWQGNTLQTVRWNSADTELAPINCQSVDIRLDLDGDERFDSLVLSDTPNDGEQVLRVPSTASTQVRLQVLCHDNVFYSLNKGKFTITPAADPIAPIITGQLPLSVAEDNALTLTLDDLQVSDGDSSYPENFTLHLENGNHYSLSSDGMTVVPDGDFNGVLSVGATVNDAIADSVVFPLVITVTPVNDAPVASEDTFSLEQDSAPSLLNVLANDSDIDGDTLSISAIDYSGNASVFIDANQLSYQPQSGFVGSESFSYTVSDQQLTSTANVTVTVLAIPVAIPTPSPSKSGGGSLGFSSYWLLGILIVWRKRFVLRQAKQVNP